MLREARLAAGLRQSDVAARGGVSQAWVSKMERGHGATASVATWAAVASAVGAQLSSFLEVIPGADRPRDFEHLKRQRLVIEAATNGGWVARPEVALDRSRTFARSIDVLLERESLREAAVVEVWDFFDDVGAALRGLDAKVAEVERAHAATEVRGGAPWRVGGLFVVRATHRNRRLIAEFASIFDAHFPGSGYEWLRVLADASIPMPASSAVVWSDVAGTRLFAQRRRGHAPKYSEKD
jgi:transcriptional regulator with XRE-family HTH domain